ncbi:MAG: two-component hybrid sensor and regulator [candidate division NC10 bacterium CSP1-5]|nr:MAG: two-component hybrid sensor and regulator [candidate division NC10 bacterium CSP1-5]KRT69467.1 MAG: two-component hybrid sensor and regulator [candidate division NC10 bacterium CSP1-5]
MRRYSYEGAIQVVQTIIALLVMAALPFTIATTIIYAMSAAQESLVLWALNLTQFAIGAFFLTLLIRLRSGIIVRKERDRIRKSTLTMLHHEFRTPATFLVGGVHLLRDPSITGSDRKMLIGKLSLGIDRLMLLIDEFLSLNDILYSDAKLAYAAHREEFREWQVAIDHVLPKHQTLLERKGLKLLIRIASDLPAVCAFSLQIEQAISHLLGNAIKFTEAGMIQISVFEIDRGVRCEVVDTGIGLSQEYIEIIFTPFEQIDREKREQQGIGLGLAIVKGLIEIHGGRLEVKSWPGKGSVFAFWLPEIDLG